MSAGTRENTEKPKLNKQQLEGHGIDFKEEIYAIEELDNWLQPIARAITRLQEDIPKDVRKDYKEEIKRFKEELKHFKYQGQDCDDLQIEDWCLMPTKTLDYRDRERYTIPAAETDRLDFSQARQAVQNCHMRNEHEEKWTQILHEYVFWDFAKTNEGLGSYEQKLSGWELHQNVLWNEFPQWAKMNPNMARVTQPKPDFTYGFPVVSPHDELFKVLNGDVHVDSFSLPVLAELRNRGKDSIISAPTTGVWHSATKKTPKLLEAKDLMCFPWAIVEVKRGTAGPSAGLEHKIKKAEARAHERRTQFCYCQAANASAAGLTLRERLAANAKDNSGLRNARVMFSFTCVGSAVKLWITYREKPVSLITSSK
ncbi:hypothetical protein N0V86_005513 [Didymella sp. IMI 355093]|nr:hypothetical protein N0V86_005513 [Didymella sp. IMI 355093]